MFRTHLQRTQKEYGSKGDTEVTDVDTPELKEYDKQKKENIWTSGQEDKFYMFHL